MKKMTLILLSCLLLSFFTPCSFAADAPDDAIAFAENYLRLCARNKFLFENNDILQDTTATLTEEEKNALIQTVKENETEFREKHSRKIIPEALQGEFPTDTVYDNQPIEEIINTFPDFISNKVSYWRHFRQKSYESGNSYGKVRIGYSTISSYASGNNLVYVQFKEMVAYTYDDQYKETGDGADYKVCLYQMNDRWIICNIVSLNDYFDEQYRFGNFNLEEEMQEADKYWEQMNEQEAGQNTENTEDTKNSEEEETAPSNEIQQNETHKNDQAETTPLLWIIPTVCIVLVAIAVICFLVMKKQKKIS